MTDTDYSYRWQAAAHRALGELIEQGRTAGLPTLTWTLAGTTGALTGEVDLLGVTVAEQRAAFTAWARLLGATVTETPRDDGHRISLHAFLDHRGERVGALRAELYLDDEPTSGRFILGTDRA
jgi:hypothetical protein